MPESLERLAADKKVASALVILVGGAKEGRLVVGPKTGGAKPVAMTQSFRGGHEVLGFGTIFAGSSGPELHLHIAAGRKKSTLVGCGRTGWRVHLIVEAVIIELAGIRARRALDPLTGFHLLKLL